MAFSPFFTYGLNEPSEGDDAVIWEFINPYPDYNAPPAPDDISTTLGSEFGVPALTLGLTTTQSVLSQASPSLDRPEDLDLHYGLDPPPLNQGQEDIGCTSREKLSFFRHIGEAPEILVQEPLSPVPNGLCLDDTAIGQSPQSPLLPADSPSQSTLVPKIRGRHSPLPKPKRDKTASMRKIKACSWCHIHKVECNEVTPCDRCVNNFPGLPKACDRARLTEVRFPDHFKSTSIWLDNYSIRFPPQPRGYYGPPIATGVSPITTFGNWPGTFNSPWVPGSLVLNEPGPAANELPVWAETQLSMELETYKRTNFPDAVGALLLAYRDTSLPAQGPAPANGKKKKQASVVNTKALVRKVLEMLCQFRIWRSPALYCRGQGRQAAGMGDNTAITALIACEKEILRDLDELDTKLALEDELPVWACLWQMILTYRNLIGMYSGVGHGPSSSANPGFNTDLGDVPAALATVEHLHRLLVIKHVAYVGSSSPIFHKRGQPETGELLAGDERLQGEWENVLVQRKEFYRTFSDEAPSDAFLKTLIIDFEADMERRRKKNRR